MSDTESPGTWSGILSALVFALIVVAVAITILSCCFVASKEVFYSRKYFVSRENMVTQAEAGKGGKGGKAGKQVEVKRVVVTTANDRYLPPEPPFKAPFVRLAPILFPWRIAGDAFSRCCLRSRLHAAVDASPFALAGNVSLDAHLYQVYLLIAIVFFAWYLAACIPVSIVNATSGGSYSDPLFALSTSRVPQGSNRLWVHFAMLCVLTLLLLGLLHLGYREYEYLRLYWLAMLSPARYSVLITGLPKVAPASTLRPKEGRELRLTSARDDVEGGEVAAEEGRAPGTGNSRRVFSRSALEEYRHVRRGKSSSEPPLAAGGADGATSLAAAAPSTPTMTMTMTATTAGIGAASLQTPSKTVGLLTASSKAPNPLTVLLAVKASFLPEGSERGYRRYLKPERRGHGGSETSTAAAGLPVIVSHTPIPPSPPDARAAPPTTDADSAFALPSSAPSFDTGHIRLLIAHQRFCKKLEHYQQEFCDAVAEWEAADAKRKLAEAQGKSVLDEQYGRVGLLKHHRRPLLVRLHLKKAKELPADKQRKQDEAEEQVTVAVALHRIGLEMKRRFGQMQLVRNRYDFSRVQRAKVNADSSDRPHAYLASSAPATAALPEASQPAQPPSLPPAPPPPFVAVAASSPQRADDTGAGVTAAATAIDASPPPSLSIDVESKGLPAASAMTPSSPLKTSLAPPAAAEGLSLEPPDIEALARERYTIERAIAEGLLPSPRHHLRRHHQATPATTPSGAARTAAIDKIKSRTRMAASDAAILTFLTAADASQVLAHGRQSFAEGRVNPASSALLLAYGLPQAGLKRTTLNYHNMKVVASPEPSDVIWDNVTLRPQERVWKPIVADVWLAVVIFVAVFPTVAAAFLSNLSAMGLVAGFLAPVTSWAGLSQGLIESLIPALIVRVVQMLLLTFVTIIAKLRGEISFSRIDVWASKWMFVAAFVSAILVYSIAATIFGASTAIFSADAAVNTLTLLAQSLPSQSGTFIAFVIIATLQGWVMAVFRPVDLIKWSICKRRDLTNRMLKRHQRALADRPPFVGYLPDSALMMAIGLLYGLMNPPIVVCLLAYFVFALVISSHQLLFVFETPWQTGGTFYPMAAGMTVGSLIFAQLVWIFLFIMKEVRLAATSLSSPSRSPSSSTCGGTGGSTSLWPSCRQWQLWQSNRRRHEPRCPQEFPLQVLVLSFSFLPPTKKWKHCS